MVLSNVSYSYPHLTYNHGVMLVELATLQNWCMLGHAIAGFSSFESNSNWDSVYFVEKVGSRGNAFDLYFGGIPFESRPGHRQSSLKCFVVSTVPADKYRDNNLIMSRRFRPYSFQFVIFNGLTSRRCILRTTGSDAIYKPQRMKNLLLRWRVFIKTRENTFSKTF